MSSWRGWEDAIYDLWCRDLRDVRFGLGLVWAALLGIKADKRGGIHLQRHGIKCLPNMSANIYELLHVGGWLRALFHRLLRELLVMDFLGAIVLDNQIAFSRVMSKQACRRPNEYLAILATTNKEAAVPRGGETKHGVMMSLKGSGAIGPDLPGAHRRIGAYGKAVRRMRRHGDVPNAVLMTFEDGALRHCEQIPYTDGLVPAARHGDGRRRAGKRDGMDPAGMPLQRGEGFICARVP